MISMRDAMRTRDYAAVSKFLDRRYIGDELGNYSDEELAKALSYVWNQQNILDITTLSDQPEGDLDDGLPSHRDKVGDIRLHDESIPVYLQRVPDGKGGQVWKISNATVARIPDIWAELGYSPMAYRLGSWLPDFRFLGMENWQALSVVLSFLVAWPLAMLVTWLLMRLALLVPNRFPNGIRRFFRVPLRFFVFLFIARHLIGQLGLSLTICTLDRSLVAIPNSVFAAQEIENFSRRDRIRYYRRYQMALPDSQSLRAILEQVRQFIAGHERVIDGTASVRFEDIRDANAILRLDAGVDTRDYQEYLRVAEELNLGVMAIAERAGARFSGPGMLLQGPDTASVPVPGKPANAS